MTPEEIFTADLTALIDNVGEVIGFGFAQISNVFTLVTEQPLLLFALGLTVFGIVIKYGKGMIRL